MAQLAFVMGAGVKNAEALLKAYYPTVATAAEMDTGDQHAWLVPMRVCNSPPAWLILLYCICLLLHCGGSLLGGRTGLLMQYISGASISPHFRRVSYWTSRGRGS